jgi:hypothetical protein
MRIPNTPLSASGEHLMSVLLFENDKQWQLCSLTQAKEEKTKEACKEPTVSVSVFFQLFLLYPLYFAFSCRCQSIIKTIIMLIHLLEGYTDSLSLPSKRHT